MHAISYFNTRNMRKLQAVIIIGFQEQIDIETMLAICNGSPSITNSKCWSVTISGSNNFDI